MNHELADVLANGVASVGLALWGFEFLTGKQHHVLRVYIDNAEQRIALTDCERASHQLSALLDVHEGLVPEPYALEVSSPGIDRKLFTPEQWAQYMGTKVRVQLWKAVNGQRRIIGTITKVDDAGAVLLDENGATWEMAWRDIERARLYEKR